MPIRLRDIAMPVVTIVAAVAGILIGGLLGLETLGGVSGALIGFPLALFLVTGQRRWIAIALLNIWFVLSYTVGEWWGALYAIAASGLTFFVSAAILRELYGGNEFRALLHHFQIGTGLLRGFQVIGDGKSLVPSNGSAVMGPRLIIIGPGNAAILEQGSRQSQVSGPGRFTSQPFEYVKRIYDLRGKQKSLTFRDVLTHDMVATTIEVCVTFGINVSDTARLGQTVLTGTEINAIRQLDAWMPDWERGTLAALEGSARQAVASLDLTEVLTAGLIPNLEQQIRDMANTRIANCGVQIHEVFIESVQPAQQVTAAATGRWVADAEQETMRYMEIGRAAAMRDALTIMADGYRRATAARMSDQQIHREVLRRTLERIAQDPATKLIFTPELHNLLSSLGD